MKVKGPKSQRNTSILTASDNAAAEFTGLRYGELEVKEVRDLLKQKAAKASKGGQFYELTDDGLWKDASPDETKARLFAAVRLVVEYDGPAGVQVCNKEARLQSLLGLIRRLATETGNLAVLTSPIFDRDPTPTAPAVEGDNLS